MPQGFAATVEASFVPRTSCARPQNPHARYYHGDLVLTDVDPLEDLAALADPEAALAAVVQGGRPIVDRLDD